jgi:hypothetical protein
MEGHDDARGRHEVQLVTDEPGLTLPGIPEFEGLDRQVQTPGRLDQSGPTGVGLDGPPVVVGQAQALGDDVEVATGVQVEVDPDQALVPPVGQPVTGIEGLIVPLGVEQAGDDAGRRGVQRTLASNRAAPAAAPAMRYCRASIARSVLGGATTSCGRPGADWSAIIRWVLLWVPRLGRCPREPADGRAGRGRAATGIAAIHVTAASQHRPAVGLREGCKTSRAVAGLAAKRPPLRSRLVARTRRPARDRP